MKPYPILLFYFLLVLFAGCKKDAEVQPTDYPFVITKDVVHIDSTGVTCVAKAYDSGYDIIDYGFIWWDSKSNYQASAEGNGESPDNFSLRISSDLTEKDEYSCKAYIQTAKYMVYGNEVVFTSLGAKAPLIIDFYPKTGVDKTKVTLIGNYFSLTQGNNKVFVNDIEAEVQHSTIDSIMFISPEMAFFGDASITLEVGEKVASSHSKFSIIGPKIISLSTPSAHPGNYVSIVGENFTQNSESLAVHFNYGGATIISYSDTKIELIVPGWGLSSNPFNDHPVTLSVVNGLKTAYYEEGFLIENSWEVKQAAPIFNPVDKPVAFSWNNKGYIFDMGGSQGNLLYEYDPNTDEWIQVSSYPGTSVSEGLFIVHENKALKIGGTNSTGFDYESWEYDFVSQSWIQKDNTSFNFDRATYFTLDEDIYIITNKSQFWKYEPGIELFTQLNNFPVNVGTGFISSFVNEGIAYAVNYGANWQYDQSNDHWILLANTSFYQSLNSPRAIGFDLIGTGYMLYAGENLYKYDFTLNNWIYVAYYPGNHGKESYKTTFVVEGKAFIAATNSYYGTGAPLLFSYED